MMSYNSRILVLACFCITCGLLNSGCSEEDKSNSNTPTPIDQGLQNDASIPDQGIVGLRLGELQNGASQLILTDEPSQLVLTHNGDTRLTIPLSGFQVGAVEEVDDTVNYDPYYIWANIPSAVPASLTWLSPESWTVTSAGANLEVQLSYSEDISISMQINTDGDTRFRLQMQPQASSKAAFIRIAKTVDESEGFYGLGKVLDQVNNRGKVRAMQLEADIRIESTNNEANGSIPLLLGSTGWGVFYHSYYPSAFGVANESDDRVDFAVGLAEDFTEGLDLYLFTSDNPLDLTKHYYDITGTIKLPARWAYGPLVWRDENEDQAQVISDLEIMRDLDLPASGLWVDRPYASGVNSFDFEPNKFPDPEEMIAELHAEGFRFALWHNIYVGEDQEATAELHQTAEENGYYPLESAPRVNPWGRLIDLTNPEAYQWWQDNLQYYKDIGVEGYKLDYVEDVIIGINLRRLKWLFADGTTERTMHKIIQYLFQKVYAEMLPDDGGLLLCRSATMGSQTLGAVIWPGDLDANFAQHREEMTNRDGRTYIAVGGLPAAVIASISLGPSGLPFFGSDTGGYRNAPPTKEVFTRWFQHTALSSIMQIGTNTNDVAWEFRENNGFDEEMLDWYRLYTRLHLRLFPYAWSYAEDIERTGRPIVRPYGLQYPQLNRHPSDVYFFGDDLLVAPVVVEGARDKLVPFPNGTWFDWWTGEEMPSGAEQVVAAPLEKLPLYIRGGGIIPMLRPTIDTLSPVSMGTQTESFANDPGRLYARIAPGEAHAFTVFDGTRIEHDSNEGPWRITVTPGSQFNLGVTLEIIGINTPSEINANGALIPQVESGMNTTDTAYWYTEGHLLRVVLPEGVQSIEFTP